MDRHTHTHTLVVDNPIFCSHIWIGRHTHKPMVSHESSWRNHPFRADQTRAQEQHWAAHFKTPAPSRCRAGNFRRGKKEDPGEAPGNIYIYIPIGVSFSLGWDPPNSWFSFVFPRNTFRKLGYPQTRTDPYLSFEWVNSWYVTYMCLGLCYLGSRFPRGLYGGDAAGEQLVCHNRHHGFVVASWELNRCPAVHIPKVPTSASPWGLFHWEY